MRKPTILTFVHHYLPGYKFGGPIRTIAHMVEQLSDELDFWIVTSDRDALDADSYPDVAVDTWCVVGKARVLYLSPRKQSLKNFARLIRETPHDILYLNSFFDPTFTLLPLLARALRLIPRRPIVIAPRGELSEGALALKAWKKRPYIWIVRALGLYRDITWHASSEREAEEIRRVLGAAARRIVVAPALPSPIRIEELDESRPARDGPLRVVFLSRITPKKNLDFALRVLARVTVPVEFHIYGPIWDEPYWRQCQDLIKVLPAHVSVHYHGSIPQGMVPDVIAAHDLFFFPTRGENFGHVILEALSAGTPVLLSDRTPWSEDGAGGCMIRTLEDMEGFVTAIEAIARYTPEQRMRMRAAARAVARSYIEREGLREKTLELFHLAASSSSLSGSEAIE